MHTVSDTPLCSEMTGAQFLPPPDPRKEIRCTSGGRGEREAIYETTPGEDTSWDACMFQSHSK